MYKKNKDNIVIISLEYDGKQENLLDQNFSKSLLENVIKLEEESELEGVILLFTKKSFLSKYDIDSLINFDKPDTCYEYIESQNAILRRIEKINAPVIAAIDGSLSGLNIGLALACKYRISTRKQSIGFEFSEVKNGILPGYGSIARLTRIIGIEKSLNLLLNGYRFNINEAIDFGFLNELVMSKDDLIKRSTQWIKSNPNALQPWDQKSFEFPYGNAHSSQNAALVSIFPAKIRKKTRGNLPAPETILSIVVEGSLVDFETATRIESRFYTQLLMQKSTKNIINANWFQLRQIKSGSSRPSSVPETFTKKIGVLGAGLMGHGIAYVSAKAGLNVVMVDLSKSSVEKGLKRIDNILQDEVKKQSISDKTAKETLGRVTGTDEYSKLKGCDFIIEAVFEDQKLKGSVTIEAEKNISNDKVFASNTSTIPITVLAEKSIDPEKFIGVHFFSPVNRMKLVEIIKGKKTSNHTLAKAFDFAIKIGKIPIVVNDSRGFYTTRVFERYAKEGMSLLVEGNNPIDIESAGKAAGFPVGPLAVIDEISIQLLADIRDQSIKDLSTETVSKSDDLWDEVIDFMLDDAKRPGKAHGKGFYEYPKNTEKFIWPGITKRFHSPQKPISQKEMVERFYFSQSIEAVRCFEEKVIESEMDANIGSIHGWGFPLFTGGVIQYINNYGLKKFHDKANQLSNMYGKRFSSPQLLDSMIKNGEKSFK